MDYENHSGVMRSGKIALYNMDCMELLRQTPDKYYSLCVVDPPYGLSRFKNGLNDKSRLAFKVGPGFNNLVPKPEYFEELFRVSMSQIIWGANNFILPTSEYFCIWDKQQTVDNFASAEYAWVSPNLRLPAKIFRYSIHQHNADGVKIHPTQKPVKLYEWLLKTYAVPGQKILDTHGGSMSIALACHNSGFDLTLCELDKDYYDSGASRYSAHIKQGRLNF